MSRLIFLEKAILMQLKIKFTVCADLVLWIPPNDQIILIDQQEGHVLITLRYCILYSFKTRDLRVAAASDRIPSQPRSVKNVIIVAKVGIFVLVIVAEVLEDAAKVKDRLIEACTFSLWRKVYITAL